MMNAQIAELPMFEEMNFACKHSETLSEADLAALEHRIEPVCTIDHVRFYNDSKATNTDAVEKALTAFDAGTIVVMLGGHDKMTDLASLAGAVCERCRVAVGDAWDPDEIYFVFDELRVAFPTATFERMSPCSGIITIPSANRG